MLTARERRYVSIAEFVRLTGLSDSTIRRRIRDGSLSAVQLGGRGTEWLIPGDALEQLARPQRESACAVPGESCDRAKDAAPHPPDPPTPTRPARRGPKPTWQRAR